MTNALLCAHVHLTKLSSEKAIQVPQILLFYEDHTRLGPLPHHTKTQKAQENI